MTREHLNLRLEDIVYVSAPSGSEGERTRVQSGDILISATADLGIIGVIPEAFGEAYVNQHIALVRIKKREINPYWIGLYLANEVGQEQFRQRNDSGAKAGLNLPTIGSVLVVLPGHEEQNKIVSIIDKQNSKISYRKTSLEKLKLLKKGLMSDLLTGRVRVQVEV